MLSTGLEILGVVTLLAETLFLAVLAGYVGQAYQVGMFQRTAIDYLFTATSAALRRAPRERTVEELHRYGELARLRAQIRRDGSSCRTCDLAIASIGGEPDDQSAVGELASRRRALHREALGRLQARVDGAGEEEVLELGVRWLRAEQRHLAWSGVREIGPGVGRAFFDRAVRAVPAAALAITGLTLFGWLLLGSRQLRPVGLEYAIVHAPQLGVELGPVAGIGWVLIGMHRRALRPALDAMSDREALRFRRLLVASFALAAATYVSLYFGWPEDLERWSLRQARAIRGPWSFVIVVPMANVFCVWWLRRAWGIWRAEGRIVRSQRVEHLGSAVFAGGILFVFDVLGPLALIPAGHDRLRLGSAFVAVALFTVASLLAGWSRRIRGP
jgi:hypothetical protein